MNKATKGAVAAGAAAVLLLGGLGSYALWSDQETLGGGTITSGDLSLAPVATPAPQWRDVSPDVAGNPKVIDPATFLIVPGDIVEYTASFTIQASGDNLLADLSADTSAITGDALLRSKITTSVTATSGITTLPTTGAKTRITSADQNVAVSVRFTFDPGTENQDAQNQSINLAAFALKLEQSRT
ncbi:alternate-type signal peptide domain-containing protein [Rhodococcoides fascians]|uniref:alternate-type signal peptide domain-containing protein n=1 Tax=Rhodococcoides fascians TaxID=1828 RepID=UPI00050C1A65|nr:alternate-type signal peptide domain-containing protein [Rhodococcus fascians]